MRPEPLSSAERTWTKTVAMRLNTDLLKSAASFDLRLAAYCASLDEEDGDRRLHDRVKHREKMDSGAKMTV